MGEYYNPPEDIKTVGRRLNGDEYSMLAAQLRPGEVLVGLYDQLIFKLAPYLPDAREFEAFESQYRRGDLISHEFFAVKQWW